MGISYAVPRGGPVPLQGAGGGPIIGNAGDVPALPVSGPSGGSGFGSSVPGAILDPFNFPPPGSTPIFLSDEQPSVGAGTITQLPNIKQAMDNNSIGVINSLTLLLDQIVLASAVFWTLTINGQPVPGVSALTVLGRSGAASVAPTINPLRIVVPPLGAIGAFVTNKDGNPYTVGLQVFGWYWPAQR